MAKMVDGSIYEEISNVYKVFFFLENLVKHSIADLDVDWRY